MEIAIRIVVAYGERENAFKGNQEHFLGWWNYICGDWGSSYMDVDMYQNLLNSTFNTPYAHSSLLNESLTTNPDILFHFLSVFLF